MKQNYRLDLLSDSTGETIRESIEELESYRGQFLIDAMSVQDSYIDRAITFVRQLHDRFGIRLDSGFSDVNFFGGVLMDIVKDSDNYVCVDITEDEIYIQTKYEGRICTELTSDDGIELPVDGFPDMFVSAIEKVIL